MEDYKEVLTEVCRGQIRSMNRLPCAIKNKLIEVSNFSVKKRIGNVELAKNILGNLQLEDIYLNRNQRINLALNLKKALKVVKDIEEGKQCKDQLVRYINFKKYLSSGSFGEVSVGNLLDQNNLNRYNKFDFAIKMAQLSKGVNPESEIHIARLLTNLVFEGRAQNLPIMVDSFNCNSCKFKNLRGVKTKDIKCIFTINEIANGDLASWLQTKPSASELQSCLFQIMAGIHALQYYFLLENNDIKAPNILFYNVNPGGYWKYTIYGRDFYVPNYGKLFIVNDFGVSEIYAPRYQLPSKKEVNIGARVFMINNHKLELIENPSTKIYINKKIGNKSSSILNWSDNSKSNFNVIKLNQKTNKINIPPVLNDSQKRIIQIDPKKPEFYNSNLVPPFELISDTQDVLKIFLGGKRMTQPGAHEEFQLDKNFLETIKKYRIDRRYSFHMIFGANPPEIISTELSHILAGYFILDYFTKTVNYTIPKHKDEIISHIMTS